MIDCHETKTEIYLICRECKVNKPISSFYKRKANRPKSWPCKACENNRSRKDWHGRKSIRKPRDKNYGHTWRLMRYYGITPEQYAELLEKQGGKCAICLKEAVHFTRKLAVDHDHKTGEIFGLLCMHCNHRKIGRERNPEVFLRCAEYLTKGTGLFVPPVFIKGKRPKRKRKKNI